MDNLSNSFSQRLRRMIGGWVVTAVLVLGLVVVLASFAKNTSAAGQAQAVAPTMQPMPGMTMPTAVPGNTQPSAGSDIDVLTQKMQAMMQSLQGMMGQLDQKSTNGLPAAQPTTTATVDMQALMTEMQAINQTMGPLMLRIQADLQGTPSAEELASVRAQVEQVYGRMSNLITHLQAARGNAAPAVVAATPTMAPMPGMNPAQPATGSQQDQSQAMMTKLDQLMQKMQGMVQQLQGQQAQSGSTAGQPGSMPGMNMPAPAAVPGMGSMPPQATPMPGMSTSDPAMGGMMSMMDNMMAMMDGMMGMGSMPSASAPAGGMNMATPTAMPAMSSSSMPMDNMMMMMDSMMMMMDDMMMKMDNMMGMPDM